jgi:O-antigen ligase
VYSPDQAHVAMPRAHVLARAGALVAPLAGGLVTVLLLGLAFHDGGYFPSTIRTAAVVASLGLVALLALPAARRRMSRAALPAFLALAALAAWTGLSRGWSPEPAVAVVDMWRDVLYVALFGLALVASGSPRSARMTVRVLLATIVVVAGAGVLSRLAPELLGMTRGASFVFDERLSFPLGYWNAFGALAAVGAVLALGLAADVRAPAHVRGLCAGAVPLLAVALHLSLSRGAWLALVCGLAMLLVLAPRRASVLLSALVVAAIAALAIVRLQAQPQLLDGTLAAGDDAPRLAVELLLLCALAGFAQALLSVWGWSPKLSRRAGAGALAVTAAACGAALALGGAAWIERQYDAFRAPAPVQADRGTQRLLSAGGLRSEAYGVALDGFRAQPLRGEGAGSFAGRWERSRSVELPMRDAHSLVLGTMTELGAVGLSLLAAFLASVAVAARRTRRRRGGLRRSTGAAAAAAIATWLAHAGLDWDWEMPALTGCALVLCATLFARPADPLQYPQRGAVRDEHT